jgi:hypothetical protein
MAANSQYWYTLNSQSWAGVPEWVGAQRETRRFVAQVKVEVPSQLAGHNPSVPAPGVFGAPSKPCQVKKPSGRRTSDEPVRQ